MSAFHKYVTFTLASTGLMFTSFTGASSQAESSHRVKATLLRQESSLHTSLGNRDAYLLMVKPAKGEEFEALAIDNYPGYVNALRLGHLDKSSPFSIRLIRTPYCDRLSESDSQNVIRCFEIDRNGWKAPASSVDAWWK